MAETGTAEYWGRNAYGGYGDARDPSKPSGMQSETQRYADQAAAANQRGAYQAQYGGYNDSIAGANNERGAQQDAAGLMRNAAYGNAPSAAEIAGRSAGDQALNSTIAAAGSAKGGPMQQAAAMRQAQGGLAVQNQNIVNGIQAGRANEMAQARDQYGNITGAIRQGDLSTANTQLGKSAQDIQNEQFQRGLNQNQNQFSEGQRQKVFEDQLAANQNAQHESDAAWNAGRGSTMTNDSNMWGKFKDVAGMVAGAGTGGAGAAMAAAATGGPIAPDKPTLVGEEGAELIVPTADGGYVLNHDQTKQALQHRAMGGPLNMGSLAGLGGMPGGGETGSNPTGSMSVKGGGLDVMGSLAKTNAIDTQYMKNPGGGMVMRAKGGPLQTGLGHDAATDKAAGADVAARRKAGGYAMVDMTPIPQGVNDPGYQSPSDLGKTAALHGAIEADTEGATPYAGGQPNGEQTNYDATNRMVADDLQAKREREGVGNMPSIADIAGRPQNQQGGGGSRLSSALLGMSGNLFGGVFAAPIQRREEGGPLKSPEAQKAYEDGLKHGADLAAQPPTDVGTRVDAGRPTTAQDMNDAWRLVTKPLVPMAATQAKAIMAAPAVAKQAVELSGVKQAPASVGSAVRKIRDRTNQAVDSGVQALVPAAAPSPMGEALPEEGEAVAPEAKPDITYERVQRRAKGGPLAMGSLAKLGGC